MLEREDTNELYNISGPDSWILSTKSAAMFVFAYIICSSSKMT